MQTIPTSEEFGISPVQYARARGWSLNWVYSLIWTGALPAKKMFGRWFIEPDATPERAKRRDGAEAVSA